MARIDCEGAQKVQKSGGEVLYIAQVKNQDASCVWRCFQLVQKRRCILSGILKQATAVGTILCLEAEGIFHVRPPPQAEEEINAGYDCT